MSELTKLFGQRPLPVTPELRNRLDEIKRLEARFNKKADANA